MSTFYIASLKHTSKDDEHITFWARFHKGYTPVMGAKVGKYCFGEASVLNDGVDCIAVPCKAVDALLSPEPFYKPGAKFFDQVGPVVDNTRAIWTQLIAASLVQGRLATTIKLTPYTKQRRSFAWSSQGSAA